MAKTKNTLKAPKNRLNEDFTEKPVNKVNVRFNNNCTMELLVNMTELTITGLIHGEEASYTIEGTITEVV